MGGFFSDVWSFWFKALEKGKRKDISTGVASAALATSSPDDVGGFGTIILEPAVGAEYYEFSNQVDFQNIYAYNNGTTPAVIASVTGTIPVNRGKIIQWDDTLSKWLETTD
jgi:hypothetical protein